MHVEVGAVEEGVHEGMVDSWEILRLRRQSDFGSQAFTVFVLGDLGQVELRGLWCTAFLRRWVPRVHEWWIISYRCF